MLGFWFTASMRAFSIAVLMHIGFRAPSLVEPGLCDFPGCLPLGVCGLWGVGELWGGLLSFWFEVWISLLVVWVSVVVVCFVYLGLIVCCCCL